MLALLAAPGLAAQGGNGSINTARSLKSEAKAAEGADEILGIAYSNAAIVTAPGTDVGFGAYQAAFSSAASLPVVGGSWTEVQDGLQYNADNPDYRDPNISNSGGGSGLVAGRMTGLGVMPNGLEAYAGAAGGGVWKTTDGGTHWTPVFDQAAASIAIGSVAINPDDLSVWVGTGENNTAFENFKGAGVFRSTDHGATWQQVGAPGLVDSTIGDLQFDGKGNVYAATSRGLFRTTANATGSWTKLLDAATFGYPAIPYGLSIVNDVKVQPGTDGKVVVANMAWRNGAAYNGFYVSRDGGAHWAQANLSGAINPKEVGSASMAYSSDGKALYAVIESTFLFNKPNVQTGNTVLAGVYVSPTGNPDGPWNQIANYRKLQQSGSALKLSKGYAPGVQAWYNRFIGVDPADSRHVYVGLEEVYETRNGGSTWDTIGPYWNFGMPCMANGLDSCPKTTHPDQHAVAFGGGKVWVGNDGGVYSRSLAQSPGSPEGWNDLNAELRTLQYYGAAAGNAPAEPANPNIGSGTMFWGGMQDNGVSLQAPGLPEVVSPFGGDGGYQLVDPNNGDRAISEYTGLDMWKTVNGGYAPEDPSNLDLSTVNAWQEITPSCSAFLYTPNPCDPATRFIAPFTWDNGNIDHWLSGGQFVWSSTKGFDTTCSSSACDWKIEYDTGAGHSVTALDVVGSAMWAGWCGPATSCNPSTASTSGAGFSSGIATDAGGTWHEAADTGGVLPNRYVSAVAVDPSVTDGTTAYAAFGGFTRRWIDSAGVGHVFRTTDGGTTWTDVSGNLPDSPARDILVTSGGDLVVAMDVGVFLSSDGGASWSLLGGNLPHTIPDDLSVLPSGNAIMAATHGRGLWTIELP